MNGPMGITTRVIRAIFKFNVKIPRQGPRRNGGRRVVWGELKFVIGWLGGRKCQRAKVCYSGGFGVGGWFRGRWVVSG